MSALRERLVRDFRDPEYRHYYAEQHLHSTLATQISAIREQRGLTQARLARKIEKHQTAISRIENVNYARWNVATLKQVAAALGCWLNIRLESWGSLVEDAENYSSESLRRRRFEDDPFFWGSVAPEPVPESVRWIQQKLLPWLESNVDDELLLQWLQGRELPPVGDQDPPYVWITRAIEVEGPESRHRALLVGWLAKFVPQAREIALKLEHPDDFLVGLFNLVAVFRVPEMFGPPLQLIYDDLTIRPESSSETVRAAFMLALIRNQPDLKFRGAWLSAIETGGHPFLPANELDAFEGLKWLPPRPNLRALAQGLKFLQDAAWSRPNVGIDVRSCMRDIRDTFNSSFSDHHQLSQFLWREGVDVGWTFEVVTAWVETFVSTLSAQIELGKIAYAYRGSLVNEFRTRIDGDPTDPEIAEAMSEFKAAAATDA